MWTRAPADSGVMGRTDEEPIVGRPVTGTVGAGAATAVAVVSSRVRVRIRGFGAAGGSSTSSGAPAERWATRPTGDGDLES